MQMKLLTKLAIAIFLSSLSLACAVVLADAQQGSTNQKSKQDSGNKSTVNSQQDDVARGRYLVEEVAQCPQCHTPRDANGALDRSRWLQGGPIWFTPAQSKPRWAMQAPALAGFPYTDQQAEDILERGIGTNGNPIQPPMHIYHLNHSDAVAIIAYLRSVRRGVSHP
jgi:mono/diheme cytochrome c family protein